ncbi:MAG: hypothetical protein V1758_08980 [Pseudomonadota bacterium]
MKKMCAWCRKNLGTIDSDPGTEDQISHGICKDCQDNLFFQLGVDLQVFLDSLKVPVLVVDSNKTVVTGNNQAQVLFNKTLLAIQGYKPGEVFECPYARLPEGCGNTVHCSGCAIRRAVMETYSTGKSLLRIPATLNQCSSEKPEKIKLLISTERLADVVLLRIDDIEMKEEALPRASIARDKNGSADFDASKSKGR